MTVASLLLGTLAALGEQEADAPAVAFRTCAVGALSQAAQAPQVILLREPEDLRRIETWIGKGTLAAIDLPSPKDHVFLWLVAGMRGSTGHEILITRVLRMENPSRLRLEVCDLPPEVTGRGSDPALTYPFALISIPKEAWTGAVEMVDGRGHARPSSLHTTFQAP